MCRLDVDLQVEKVKLKSRFDAEYDQSKDPDSAYLKEMQQEVDLQSKVTVSFFLFPATLTVLVLSAESFGVREHARGATRALRRLSSRDVRALRTDPDPL